MSSKRADRTERRRRDTGINTKSMINWPVRRGGLEVGVERHLLRVGIALYIQRPIAARTGSQATFCFPRFWISSLSQLLHSTGQVHELRACNYVAQSKQAEWTRIVRNIAHCSSFSSYQCNLEIVNFAVSRTNAIFKNSTWTLGIHMLH